MLLFLMILGAARGSFLAHVVPAGRLEIVTHVCEEVEEILAQNDEARARIGPCETQVARARVEHEVMGVSCEAKPEQK